MATLVASVVASMVGTLVLTLVYLYLSRRDKERYLRVWAYSWVIYSLRFPFKAAALLTAPGGLYLDTASHAVTLVAGVFLLHGTYLFLRKPFHHAWVYGCAAAGAWLLVMTAAGYPGLSITLPMYVFLALVYLSTGAAFLGSRTLGGAGKLLTGWAFVVWGLYKAVFPFLEAHEQMASVAYQLGASFGMLVAVGILLAYFQKVQQELEASQQQFRLVAESAHEAETKFRGLVEQSLTGIYVIQERRFVYVNPKFAEIFGYNEEELIERVPTDQLVADRDRPLVRENIRRRLDGEVESVHYGFSGVRKDGAEIQVEVHGTRAEYNGRPAVLGTLLDVTERKRAEERQRQLEGQIQHAQKLESLGVLAGGIAHDFNNLLMGILGNAGLALLDLPSDSRARGHLQQVERAAQRAAELTSQMLAYSGKGQFVVGTLHLSRTVNEIVGLLSTVISKNASLDLRLRDHLPPIRGDASQIRQVIMNLITNASDALEDRPGVITVTTGETAVAADPLVSVAGELAPGRYVFLEVADTGKGMDEATQARIFDPFFTTKFTGRGLGLAAVLGILRGHRGGILVESRPGRGSTFRVLLPCGEAEEEKEAAADESRLPFDICGVVLAVDDDPNVLDVARKTLERAGLVVLCAENGRQAVELFRQHRDDVSVVLLDMTMPEMDGAATFQELMRERRDVRVILSSGYDEREATRRFQEGELAGFLQKPYGPRDLVRKVWEVFWK